ncbi:MAG TPA: hypothetical protein VHV30_14745 [Polyangiaceae bacterium]|jgi:hypothetical protein|nr:hypothetical protein [Polyangiaceae bacterium]
MIEFAYNPSLNVLCARASGAQVAAHNEKLVVAIDELDRHGRTENHPVAFLLELAPDCEAADPHWRRRFAGQRRSMTAPRAFISVITTSRVLRGVMTAMNWINPDPPHVNSMHHATREESMAWIELVQGTPVSALSKMFDRIAVPSRKTA